MSPFLERGTFLKEGDQLKYVTVNGRIYFSDATGPMNIAFEKHSELAERAGADEYDENDRPIVDDGGILVVHDGKLSFTDITGSCKIRNTKVAREVTFSVAKKILGEDKVA